MKLILNFLTIMVATALAAPTTPQAAAATAIDVAYDNTYDNGDLSTSKLACSDGSNGLIIKGYNTIGALPSFPLVGGAPTIAEYNSPNCGACYSITYNSQTIYVTAIDVAVNRFVLSQEALDQLTDGQAVHYGHVSATYDVASPSNCGFK
ncbi:Cerato-platanin [Talaromyces proteolyticus]|uniref:Cerato-platanin n=1 Tax=Talaromyces proteolyticus TaxID=1131652 RepID=A0AAD4PWG7_9EURO|nr:Cerato-platanin [Talaromyces proteolyticus]KAH8697845.1 Cerato-platanin [Talaromyces proteolyticus]